MRRTRFAAAAIATVVTLTACAERSKSEQVCSKDVCVATSFGCANGKRKSIAIVVGNYTDAPIVVKVTAKGNADPVKQEETLQPLGLMTLTDNVPTSTTFTYTVYSNDAVVRTVKLGRNEDCLEGDVSAK